MSVIKMYGYEAAQQTEYKPRRWATKEEMRRCRLAMSSAM